MTAPGKHVVRRLWFLWTCLAILCSILLPKGHWLQKYLLLYACVNVLISCSILIRRWIAFLSIRQKVEYGQTPYISALKRQSFSEDCDNRMHLKGTTSDEMAHLFPHTSILVGYRGSIAHNMYTPSTDPLSIDDKDVMGICIAPQTTYYGLNHYEGSDSILREWDVVVYEVRKFVRLLAKANPNVLSLLWLQPHHYLCVTEEGQQLLDARALFMTKQLYHAFTGYAYAQLKKMTHLAFQGYMGDKRKQLVAQFGYDTKNAAHLIRLLRMGTEALVTGELHVFRDDAPQLLEIKRGLWSLEQVKDEATHLFRRAELAYDRCALPTHPDYIAINQVLIMLLDGHFSRLKVMA